MDEQDRDLLVRVLGCGQHKVPIVLETPNVELLRRGFHCIQRIICNGPVVVLLQLDLRDTEILLDKVKDSVDALAQHLDANAVRTCHFSSHILREAF